MICPKGYAMSAAGVCGGDAVFGHTGDGGGYNWWQDVIDKSEWQQKEWFFRQGAHIRRGGNSRETCMDNCDDMMGQYNSCMMGNDTGGACTCTDIPYNYNNSFGEIVVTFQQMCNWNGASPGQCYSNCFGGGRRVAGRPQGGQGTNRRTGGPIRKFHYGGSTYNALYGDHPMHHYDQAHHRRRKNRRGFRTKRRSSSRQGTVRRMGGQIRRQR